MTEENELTQEAAEEAVSLFQNQDDPPWEWGWLGDLWRWLGDIWSKLWSLAREAAAAVWDWLGSFIESIWSMVYSLRSKVTGLFSHIWDTVSDVVSSWVQILWGWIQGLWDTIGDWFSSLGASMANFFTNLWQDISSAFESLGRSMATFFTELPGAISRELVDPISDWFAGFIDSMLAFPTRILMELKRWLIDFPMWMAEDFGERVIYGFTTSFEWVGRWMEKAVGNILEGIIGYVRKVGRVDPTNAPTVAGGLLALTGVMVGGLSAMTLAGELMHPLKEIGMGHISAMIGDCVNYKAISGAFMAALVAAVVATPMRYYFNYALRPWLPGPGEIAESMSRDLFIDPDSINPELADGIKSLVGPDGGVAFEKRLLGYRGFHDEYYPMFKELANSRVGYFALAGIARGGTFDEKLFRGDLMRAGYYKPIRELLIDMYRRSSIEEAKGLYIGYPMGAFREGWFDEARLSRELVECGIPEAGLPKYLHAAWIMYEVDLLSDRLAGLKDAYRKGLATDKSFMDSLTGWGMKTERAAEHLSREQIRRYGKL